MNIPRDWARMVDHRVPTKKPRIRYESMSRLKPDAFLNLARRKKGDKKERDTQLQSGKTRKGENPTHIRITPQGS